MALFYCVKCEESLDDVEHWVMGRSHACRECVKMLDIDEESGGHWQFNSYLWKLPEHIRKSVPFLTGESEL